jgi:hypothetical protein
MPFAHAGCWRHLLRMARQAEAFFWMQGSARPEWPLVLLSAMGGRARRSAYIIDAWKPQLRKIGIAAVVQKLDPCFVAFREGCEELQTRFPKGRFEWLPFGVDTDIRAVTRTARRLRLLDRAPP